MKAAVYYGRHDVRIEVIGDPAPPGAGELLIGVSKSGICGADSAEWDHGPVLAVPPVVLGHEVSGEVVDFGAGVAGFAAGDRIVSGAGRSWGICEWCLSGGTNLCEIYRTLGLHANGGLAEYVSPARICHKDVCTEDLPAAPRILERSRLSSAVIDHVIALDALLDEGLSVLAEGRATGKILVDLLS